LSAKRAAAVREALIQGYGIDGARLTVKGLGATQPLAPNDTPEGRQNNRRVELVKG
jgi:flagellar motor protein MotB